MHLELAKTLRNYDRKNLSKDILTGLIIMAVSIPISMGYAQIAGLPAVYGLYGSVFPIILFGLFSTSPQFIFGVDAAPAALIGAALVEIGIQSGSEQAMAVVPVLTFFVAVWLFIFAFFKAGKLVNYISAPVMGGFITGICTTIILMQVPKLMGGTAGTGELPELAEHIWTTLGQINLPSLILGLISLVILLVMKKIMPKFPMVVVLMAALNLTGNKVFYLYPEEAGVQEFVHRNETTPVIVLYNEASETHIWWLLDELSEYENIYLASISGEGEILTSENFLNGNAAESQKYIVYMADCENQGEELQRLLGTEFPDGSDASVEISYEEIARKNMWTIYEICSVK